MNDQPTRRQPGGDPVAAASSSTGGPRPWSVVGLVIRREMLARGLSASYLVSSLILLLILVGVIVIPQLLSGPTVHRVGVVGADNQPIVDLAAELANTGGDPAAPTSVELQRYPDETAARTGILDGEVTAVLVDGEQVLVERASGFTGNDLLDLLQSAAGRQRIDTLVGADLADDVRATLDDEVLAVTALTGQDAAQTQGRSIIAYGGLVLTYMLILQYGVWTLTGVTEEKANRVIEILLSTARPWQLFAGKVIGIALLGLTQFAVTLTAAAIAIRVTGAFELPAIPSDIIVTLVVWILLGFATYLVVFGAAGALASKVEDAQSASAPISIMILAAFFSSFAVLNNPTGTMAVVGTFIPFWAPFVVPIRAALGALPVWQGVTAVGLSVATVIGLTIISAHVYRGGSLQFGGRLDWHQALRRAGS